MLAGGRETARILEFADLKDRMAEARRGDLIGKFGAERKWIMVRGTDEEDAQPRSLLLDAPVGEETGVGGDVRDDNRGADLREANQHQQRGV